MKLCKDCKNFMPADSKCNKSPRPMDFINGVETGYYGAQIERESLSGCGRDARFFEPKEAA